MLTCREPCQPATGAGRGGSPWGLISFPLQCLPSRKTPASLPGLQTGPLSCALRKALGVNVSSPGTPNLAELLLHRSAPLGSPRGQDASFLSAFGWLLLTGGPLWDCSGLGWSRRLWAEPTFPPDPHPGTGLGQL